MQEKNDRLIRLIMHKVPWPTDAKAHPGLELRWRVTLGDEELLKAAKYAHQDGALALLDRGVSPDTMMTIRHAHLPYDSFNPAPVGLVAKPAQKRRASIEKMKEKLGITKRAAEPDDAEENDLS